MLSVVGAAILIAQPEADALLFALVALFCVALVLVLAAWGALARARARGCSSSSRRQ